MDGRKILRLLAWFVSTRSPGWLGGRSARTSNLLLGGWDENQKAWHRHITAHGSGGAGLAGHRGGAASDAPDVLSAPANFCSLLLPQASIESQGYVDRIYCHHDTSKGVAQLLRVGRGLDPSQPEEVSEYDLYQTASFSNTVVFNPWKDGKRGPAHPDFDDDGYKARQKFESSLCLAECNRLDGGRWSTVYGVRGACCRQAQQAGGAGGGRDLEWRVLDQHQVIHCMLPAWTHDC